MDPENNQQKTDNFELEVIIKSKRHLTESEIKTKNEENGDQQQREEEKSESTNFLKIQPGSVESDDFIL